VQTRDQRQRAIERPVLAWRSDLFRLIEQVQAGITYIRIADGARSKMRLIRPDLIAEHPGLAGCTHLETSGDGVQVRHETSSPLSRSQPWAERIVRVHEIGNDE
jgi:hypothetical protein